MQSWTRSDRVLRIARCVGGTLQYHVRIDGSTHCIFFMTPNERMWLGKQIDPSKKAASCPFRRASSAGDLPTIRFINQTISFANKIPSFSTELRIWFISRVYKLVLFKYACKHNGCGHAVGGMGRVAGPLAERAKDMAVSCSERCLCTSIIELW